MRLSQALPRVVLGVAFVATTAVAAESEWLEKQKEWSKACEEDFAMAERIAGPLLDVEDGEPKLKTMTATKRASRRMGAYRGGLKESFAVAKRFAARLEKGETLTDVADFLAVEHGCHTIGYFRLGKAALNGIAAYRLQGEDAKEVADGVLRYVRRDIDEPLTLIDVLTRLELATRAARAQGQPTERFDVLRAEAQKLKKKLQTIAVEDDTNGALTAAQFAGWPEAKRKAWSEHWREELRGTDKIRTELKTLVGPPT